MSWKHVLNGDKGEFKNCVEVSSIAGKMGYKFFLYHGIVYCRDETFARYYETGIVEEDLI